MKQVTIIDGATVLIADENEERIEELCENLLDQLRRSVQKTCKHLRKRVVSTSESGSNTTFVGYDCPDCRACFTEEVTPAHYLRLLEDDYTETEKAG